jgi:hypothetical protein
MPKSIFEALPVPMEQQIRKRTISHPSWDKQITRQQAVVGKLLEDQQMNKFLFGTRGDSEDRMYVPDLSVKAGTHAVRSVNFARAIGRADAMKGSALASPPAIDSNFIAPDSVLAAERLTRPTGPRGIAMSRQISRSKATTGHLLLDDSTRNLAKGAKPDESRIVQEGGAASDTMLNPSITRRRSATGHHDFSRSLGRNDPARSGSRLSAAAATGVYWRATKIPNASLIRPSSSPTGVAWEKQINRQQAVVGKLLEDHAMNKFLNGAGAQGGADFYDADDSYFRRAPPVPNLSRQTDRLTAVSGKLLEDRSYAQLMHAANRAHDQNLFSAARRSAHRRRARGDEKRQASAIGAYSHESLVRPSSSPSEHFSGAYGGGALARESGSAIGVQRFGDQIGRVPFHRAGQRSAAAPSVGAAKRSDLLSSGSDHLFR